jgi:hypothetical protein
VLRLMGLISPSEDAPRWQRARGFLLLLAIVFVLLAIGFGLAELVSLPFGGVGTLGALLIGFVIIVAVLGVLTLLGRRRQARAQESARAQARETSARLRP